VSARPPRRGGRARDRERREPRPKSAREIALNVLYHVDTRKAFADLQLSRALKEGSLMPRDAALATELVNGTLRWRSRLDWILGGFVRAGLDTLTPWILNDLRLGAYQLLFLDRVPPFAAVDEAVKLAKKYGNPGSAGLVNAVLRKMLREGDQISDPEQAIEEPEAALAVAFSHPEWLVSRWVRRFGLEETRELLLANNQPTPVCLRVNPLRTDRETLRRALLARGVVVEAAPYSRLSLRVRGNLVLAELPEFEGGHFFVQDESETLVAELVGAEPGETVLDLAAAPGGKATQIQESRGSRGFLIAADAQMNRLGRIRENLRRMGVERVGVVCADARDLALAHPVDRVLVDAPCSGLGVLARRTDARWRKTEVSMRAILPLQREMLEAAAAHVKPGGVLVYSVCSFEPEEGSKQIDGFLSRHAEFTREDAAQFVPGEIVTEECVLLYPHRHGTDGAFGARLRRKK
jgi:16S rRNA (cytosine967-C5)-methyltransferase